MGIKESELGLPRLGLPSVLELPRITACNFGVDSKLLAGKHSKLENKVISAKYSQQFFSLTFWTLSLPRVSVTFSGFSLGRLENSAESW